MNHVIIEGTDKCGKSTLAYELAKNFYFPTIKRLKPKPNLFTEYIDTLTDTKESMIIDRFHLSEEAYGPVKRGKSRLDLRELRLIEMGCLSLNTFNIYCVDDIEKIKKRMVELNEEYLAVDEVEDILNSFKSALNNSILDWHIYRIGDNINDLVEKIKDHFKKNPFEDNYELFSECRTIGNYDGEVLIIGEKYGPNSKLPRVPFSNNTPGLNLFRALDASLIPFNKIILTNAIKIEDYEYYNKEALTRELSFKNIKKVICLGNVSYETVIKHTNKAVYKIPHPAHWFRYGGTMSEYIKKFNEIYLL